MSEHVIHDNGAERVKLQPVVLSILGLYAAILISSYLIGNLIYQIP